MARKMFISDDMGLDESLVAIASALNVEALIWPWLIPYFDDWGRADASALRIKGKIFPLFPAMTVDLIESALRQFTESGLITLYVVKGKRYMSVDPDKWFRYQTHIHSGKRTEDKSRFPAAPPSCEQHQQETRAVAELPKEDKTPRKIAEPRAKSRNPAQNRASPSPSPSPSLSPLGDLITYGQESMGGALKSDEEQDISLVTAGTDAEYAEQFWEGSDFEDSDITNEAAGENEETPVIEDNQELLPGQGLPEQGLPEPSPLPAQDSLPKPELPERNIAEDSVPPLVPLRIRREKSHHQKLDEERVAARLAAPLTPLEVIAADRAALRAEKAAKRAEEEARRARHRPGPLPALRVALAAIPGSQHRFTTAPPSSQEAIRP